MLGCCGCCRGFQKYGPIWLFLQIGVPLCGCPDNKSPDVRGTILGPLFFGSSRIPHITTVSDTSSIPQNDIVNGINPA